MERGPLSVLIVDSQILVREGIASLIDSIEDYSVRWFASNTAEALETIQQESPDIMLSEVALPGPSGVELLHELERRSIKLNTLMVSSLDAERTIRLTLAAGATGFVLKSTPYREFVNALDCIAQGQRYLPESLAHLASSLEISISGDEYIVQGDPLGPLSNREREIFHLLANGMQNAHIAKQLYISPRTVETHRARVVRKLGLNSNAELIRFAIKHGLSTV